MLRLNFSKFTNIFLFGFFCLGIVLGRSFNNFLAFFVLSCCLSVVFFIFHKRNKPLLLDSLLLVFFLSLGAFWYVSSYVDIDKFLHKEVDITLKVASLPQAKTRANTFSAQIKTMDSQTLDFKVKVIDSTRKMDYLQTYKFKSKIAKRKYKGREFYSLWVKSDTVTELLPAGFLNSMAKKTSDYIFKVFDKNCTKQSYRFLASVFLGRRELLADEAEFFSNAGVSHLLAISGLHIGLTCLTLFFILRFFNIEFRACLIISLILLHFYTFLVGASSSTLRAAVMYSVFAFSFLLRRKSNPLNSLALAGFVILFMDAAAIFTIGFQLSFASVLSIILGFRIFKIRPAKILVLNHIKQIFFCSLFVSLFITPIVSYYFGKIYILSIFYNILLIPFFTLILGINFLLIIFSPITFIAQSLGGLLSVFIWCFIGLIRSLGSLSLSFIVYTFSAKILSIYYLFLIGILAIFSSKKSKIGPKYLEN